MKLFSLNPVARKRWRRFREIKRGWYSLWLLIGLFAVSLCSELLCNSKPLLLRWEGKWYFPLFCFYPEDEFLHNGVKTRTDYRRLLADDNGQNWALRALCHSDPYSVTSPEELQNFLRVQVRLRPLPRVGLAKVDANLQIVAATGLETVLPESEDFAGRTLGEFLEIPAELSREIASRLADPGARERFTADCTLPGAAGQAIRASIAYRPALNEIPATVRVMLRLPSDHDDGILNWWLAPDSLEPQNSRRKYDALPAEIRNIIEREAGRAAAGESVADSVLEFAGRSWKLSAEREKIRFPFRPVKGHLLGLDEAGRDVFARILYGLRSSLAFGLILVILSLGLGSLAGLIQGYIGGWCDILGQRMIEIWSSLPFLYIIILMGSIYGPSFSLLLCCYALFNWIGISYYMRAEVLRLRKQPFVEAARCLGLPGWKIALRHILPNALVPLITFFPFSLVGAIGALASLDYLGFGLPPPTPSLGQLLQQAQIQRWAWWLIAYPSLALFVVMLLGIFIGEGVREAFDPRRQSRLK